MNTLPTTFTKPRDYSLDFLKTIAILMVCLYHFSLNPFAYKHIDQYTVYNLLSTVVFMCNAMCIPIFFVVNGALLLTKPIDTKKHVIKSCLTIVSYIVLKLTTILIVGVFNKVDFSNVGILSWVSAILLFNDFPGVSLNHLWFIPMLISLYILLPLLQKTFFSNNKDTLYLKVFLFILFCISFIRGDGVVLQKCILGEAYAHFDGINSLNPFGDGKRCCYILYYILGGLIYKNKEKFINIKWYLLVLSFFLGLTTLFLYWHFQYDTWDYVFNGYSLFPTIIMTLSIVLLCLKINTTKITKNKAFCYSIKTIGSNTLATYYIHVILGHTIFTLIKPYLQYSIMINFIKALSFVVISTIIGVFIKKIPIIRKLFL